VPARRGAARAWTPWPAPCRAATNASTPPARATAAPHSPRAWPACHPACGPARRRARRPPGRRRAPWLEREGRVSPALQSACLAGKASATRPSSMKARRGPAHRAACKLTTAGSTRRAAAAPRRATDQAVRWPAWRAMATTDARHADQRRQPSAGPCWLVAVAGDRVAPRSKRPARGLHERRRLKQAARRVPRLCAPRPCGRSAREASASRQPRAWAAGRGAVGGGLAAEVAADEHGSGGQVASARPRRR
jgi:hypothetical protein